MKTIREIIEALEDLEAAKELRLPGPTTNNWTITIDDDMDSYQYKINGRDDVSIRDVADNAIAFLEGTLIISE